MDLGEEGNAHPALLTTGGVIATMDGSVATIGR